MTTTPKTRSVQVAALLAAVLLALGTVTAFAAPAGAATHSVMIKQYAYGPGALSISQGDTVTWTNQDSVEHDVKVVQGPATFQSPMLGQGDSWSHTFSTAGTYSYICSVHPDMRATVTAKAKPAPAPAKAHPATHAPAATALTSPEATSGAERTTRPARDKVAAAAASSQVAGSDATQQVAAPVTAASSTLDPLLLVAGASTAVMVFCLLLLTSRPVAHQPEPPADD
jgi:plastocyanin